MGGIVTKKNKIIEIEESFDPEKEWKGMPEFKQEKSSPIKH